MNKGTQSKALLVVDELPLRGCAACRNIDEEISQTVSGKQKNGMESN